MLIVLCIIRVCVQYLHPFEAEGYRESVRAIRMMGRDCIMKRIKMIEDGVEAPNDILAHILQLICMSIRTYSNL